MPEKESDSEGFDDMAKRLEAALGGSSNEPTANGILNELVDDMHDIIREPRTAVIMFYRTTCPFCEQLMPILEDLADEYKDKVFFGKCNVDNVEESRSKYNILGVPVTMAFKKGMPVARVDGLRGTDDYAGWIESIFSGLRPMSMDRGLLSDL